jgi:DNA primase
MGTALTEQHVRLLKGMVKEVVLVFDGDAAGGAATERSISLFLDAGMRVRVVTLPEGEDPDSFLRHHTGEDLLGYVNEAVSCVDYLLTRAARFADLRHPAGQADCVTRLAPLLRKIDNQVERWGYVTLVSERLGLPPEVIEREMYPRQTAHGYATAQPTPRTSRPPSPTKVLPEYTLLQMLCHDVHLLEQVQPHLRPEDIQDADLRAIYTLCIQLAPLSEMTVFPRILDAATTPRQSELLGQMALEAALTKPSEVATAMQDCLTKIRQRASKAASKRIRQQLASVGDDTMEQQQLLQELHRLTKQHTLSSS